MGGEDVASLLQNDSQFESQFRLFSAFPRSAIIKETKAIMHTLPITIAQTSRCLSSQAYKYLIPFTFSV